jgi:hypothetical protein
MKKLIILAGLALAFAVQPVKAQDETPGKRVTVNMSVPTGGYPCGRAQGYSVHCNVPVDGGGSAYIDVDTYHSTGFILFGNVLDLGEAFAISVSNVVYDARHRVTSLNVTFLGHTNDGDNGGYSLSAAYTFKYMPCPTNAKYCGVYGLSYITSGQQTVTYN